MGGGHGAGGEEVHDFAGADDAGDGEGAGDAFAPGGEVGDDAVMFEAGELAGAAETGLDFVAGEENLVLVAPLAHALHVGDGGEGGGAALVGFHENAGDLGGGDAFIGEALFEEFERGVFGAEAIGEGDLDEAGVEVDDPFFKDGDAAGLLGAEGAAVEGFFVGDDDVLRGAADLHAVGAGEFDRAFDGFRADGEEEDLLMRLWHEVRETLDEVGADFVGEAVVGEEAVLGLFDDGVDDFGAAVAGVGDEDAGGPIDPLVAPFVFDGRVEGGIPYDGGLALHGGGLEGGELFEDGDGFGDGEIGNDAAEGGFDAGYGAGDEVVGSSHN